MNLKNKINSIKKILNSKQGVVVTTGTVIMILATVLIATTVTIAGVSILGDKDAGAVGAVDEKANSVETAIMSAVEQDSSGNNNEGTGPSLDNVVPVGAVYTKCSDAPHMKLEKY